MSKFRFSEFRPTILFLSKFVGFYLIGNLLYGWYVTAFEPVPDPVTSWVSEQTGVVLTACGWPVDVQDHPSSPNSLIVYGDRPVLAVYEGCNGLNTMIVFSAFLFAFGPISRQMVWFIPLGLALIHLANLVRITLLFLIAEHYPDAMYFVHKFLFTAFLYVVIFVLWLWWIRRFAMRRP